VTTTIGMYTILHKILEYCIAKFRETREEWPLLTVENKVNGDSKRTNERGPFLVGSLGLSCRYKRFLFCLDCSSRPQYKILFSSPYTISKPLSPQPSKLDRQPCWVACLLVCVSGLYLSYFLSWLYCILHGCTARYLTGIHGCA
jgi:hypothetical protein